MLNKQTSTSGTIQSHSSKLKVGDLVRLRFHQGLYGSVTKTGLVDQHCGQPLIEVIWTMQYCDDGEEVGVKGIDPYPSYCSRESLIPLREIQTEDNQRNIT